MKLKDFLLNFFQNIFGGLGGLSINGSDSKGVATSAFNKLTGAGLTGQQYEQNEFNAAEAEKNRRFQAEQAQLDYDRQVEFYEKYQSIGSQIRQYKENGLNPALLAGGVSPASSAPSANSPAGATAMSSQPVTESISGIFNSFLSMLKTKSEIDLNESFAAKNRADADKTVKETSWIDDINNANIEQIQQNIRESESRIDKIFQDIKESQSNIDVNNKTIEVDNKRIELMGSQIDLNASMEIINNLNAQKLELLMPYVQDMAQAELDLKNAQTEEAIESANLKFEQATATMKKALIDQKLIDSTYFDSIIKQAQSDAVKSHWDAKASKRYYKWSPVNNVVNNVCKVAVSAASVIGAVHGVPTGGVSYPIMDSSISF